MGSLAGRGHWGPWRPWARPKKRGFDLASGFVWLVGKTMENHGKPWKTSICNGWEKPSYPFLTGKMGLFDLWRSRFNPDFRQKNMSRQASTQISGLCYFVSSSFVLSLLGERNDGGWKGQLSLLLRWPCGLMWLVIAPNSWAKNQFQLVVYPQWPNGSLVFFAINAHSLGGSLVLSSMFVAIFSIIFPC